MLDYESNSTDHYKEHERKQLLERIAEQAHPQFEGQEADKDSVEMIEHDRWTLMRHLHSILKEFTQGSVYSVRSCMDMEVGCLRPCIRPCRVVQAPSNPGDYWSVIYNAKKCSLQLTTSRTLRRQRG